LGVAEAAEKTEFKLLKNPTHLIPRLFITFVISLPPIEWNSPGFLAQSRLTKTSHGSKCCLNLIQKRRIVTKQTSETPSFKHIYYDVMSASAGEARCPRPLGAYFCTVAEAAARCVRAGDYVYAIQNGHARQLTEAEEIEEQLAKFGREIR
jgi:hypothetical protein